MKNLFQTIRGFHLRIFTILWRPWMSDFYFFILYLKPKKSILTNKFYAIFRVKWATNKTSSSEVVTWLTSTNMMWLKPERFGVSVPTPWDPTFWSIVPRESNTWMKSRIPLWLDSNGPPKRYVKCLQWFLKFLNYTKKFNLFI